jgi:nanoRNase/pAp phosphatase (c-di-AMP/oligoRNAs hydrolase)
MAVVGVPARVDRATDALPSIPTDDPAVIAAVVVAILLLIGVGWFVGTRLRRPPGRKFARLLGKHEEVGVLMHPNPDPDAMASALATREIADGVDTETTLYYSGQIRHHENRAFQTVLEADFTGIENVDELEEDRLVLVDHNEVRGFSGADSVDPIAVVDHHPGDGTGSKHTDVRTDNGACATIFAEYLQELGREPIDPEEMDGTVDTEGSIPPRISTGLLYGIHADTNRLTNGCTKAEFDAASYLYSGIDEDKLDDIANPEIDAESLEIKARAITDREVRDAFTVSDVGTVSNMDAVPQAAEELRRLEGINAVVVLADKDGTIQLSGRSDDTRLHIGNALGAVVDDIPMASAGGHTHMGGGQLSIEHMQGLGPADGLTREELIERLFDAMRGDF